MPNITVAGVYNVEDYSFRKISDDAFHKFQVSGGNLTRPVDIFLRNISTFSLEKSTEEILREAMGTGELPRLIDESVKGKRSAITSKKAAPPPDTVSLIIRREEDEKTECFFEFVVSRDFLAGFLHGDSIEDFLNTYNSEDSQVIYEIASLNGAVLRETGSLETDRDPYDFPYRYVRISNRAQLKRALAKGALIKFIRHHWRRRLELYSEVVETHDSYVSVKAYGYPQLLMSQGLGLRFEIAKASHYEFGDTVRWYNRPATEPNRGLIAEFYVLQHTDNKI